MLMSLLLGGLLCCSHVTCTGSYGVGTISGVSCCILSQMSTQKAIPLRHVKDISANPDHCESKALRLTTAHRGVVCVDPNEAWVQHHVKEIEKRPKKIPGVNTTMSETHL